MLLGELPSRCARKYPNKPAIISGDRIYSFQEFNDRVNRLSSALSALGLTRCQRLAVLADNCPEYIEAYFAAFKSGLILVPLNTRLAPPELGYIVNNAEASALIVGEDYRHIIDALLTSLPSVRHFIAVGQAAGMHSYEALLSEHPSVEPDVAQDDDDVVALMYTSGTTGRPKGAMLTHRNFLANATNCIIEFDIEPSDITLHVTPLFHAAPVWPMITQLYMGGTQVVMKRFDPRLALELIERHRVNTCNLVPTILITLLDQPDVTSYDLSSLRWIGYGASPMPVPALRRAISVFGSIFIQVYGLTEASPLITCLPREEHVVEGPPHKMRRLASCGREMINVEARVVTEAGQEVRPGQVGEIIARGENIMKGYWRNPQATAETVRHGYLYTGDLATVDEEGYIFIVDRKKDMIISGGENIYSREVEEVLCAHPEVREAAVIGVPDPKWVEAVKAIVVLKDGSRATAQDIIDFCKGRLGGYKRPKSVEFADALPRNPSGKILKNVLREQFGRGQEH